MAHRHLLVSSPLALVASVFVAAPAWSLTQECETNEDCGTGFACEVTQQSSGGNTGGAGGTAGSSGSASGGAAGSSGSASGGAAGSSGSASGGGAGVPTFCGDGMCTLTETSESCSADCVEVRYCAPAECDDTSDCAAGYFCAAETQPGTGGTGPSWCGDGICTTGEDEANCAADCAVRSVCTVEWNGCTSDMDCPDGFYCDLPSSGSGSGGISGAGGDTGAGGFATGGTGGGTAGTGGGTAGTGGAEGGSGGSTGGLPAGGQAGADSAEFAAPPEGGSGGLSDPLPGACLPTDTGSGGVPGTGGVSTGGTGGTGALSAGGSAGASTGGSGAVDGGTGQGGSAGTGTGGAGSGATSGTGSGATGGTSSNSGGASGSTSSSGGMSGDTDGPKDGDHGGGCSYSASSSASPFGLIAGLAFLFARSRRRSARRG